MTARRPLRGLSEIRQYFQRDPTPTWYIDSTGLTLLAMDEWVRGFRYVSYNDCFDGAHLRTLVPRRRHVEVFPHQSLEEMNAFLLDQPETIEAIRAKGPGRAVFLFYDEVCQAKAEALGLRVVLPPPALRRRIDDKVEATRIADRAGVKSVPNVLGRVSSWEDLHRLAGHLGPDLVIQTPFGDSGTTTFFVSSPSDLDPVLPQIVAAGEVKVMRRIRCTQAAIEACVTREGTIVGPLMTELVGFPEVTPWKGGWGGNEVAADAFPEAVRKAAADATARFGEELRAMGYRGYFEIDWLRDVDTGTLYLGEVNPRVTGASSMTNLAAFAWADAPLFLFHLLEFEDVEFDLDVARLNRRWADPANMDDWGQLILKRVEPGGPTRILSAPKTGVWHLQDGRLRYVGMQTHRRTVDDENDGFFLRIAAQGDHVLHGDDLGVLVLRGRLLTPDHRLTERAQRWIAAIHSQFRDEPV